MIGHTLSRLAVAGLARRGAVEMELAWPGNAGHIGGLTNDQIDWLLENADAHTGRPRVSRAG
jgi:hypothetical protein